MKNTLLLTLSLTAIGSVASAQIDYSNPVIDIVVSNSDIIAGTAGTTAVLQALALNEGDLIVYNRGAATGEAGLYSIDISGASPVFTEIADQTALEAGTNGDTYPDVNGLTVIEGPTPTYILSQFNGGGDDIFSVIPGSPATVTNLTEFDGIFGIRTDGTTIFILTENFFGAPEDALYSIPIAGGTPAIVSSNAQFSPAGATELGPTAFALDTSVSPAIAYAFSEFSFQGATQDGDIIMAANTSTGVASEFFEYLSAPFGNVSDMVTDANGNLFVWNEGAPQLDVFDNAGSLLGSVPESAILTALGSADTVDFNLDSNRLAANVVDSNTVELYVANTAQGNIIRLTFSSATTNVSNWSLY